MHYEVQVKIILDTSVHAHHNTCYNDNTLKHCSRTLQQSSDKWNFALNFHSQYMVKNPVAAG